MDVEQKVLQPLDFRAEVQPLYTVASFLIDRGKVCHTSDCYHITLDQVEGSSGRELFHPGW